MTTTRPDDALPDASALAVVVSSFCSDGQCLGVRFDDSGVSVVDTKNDGALRFTRAEWTAFVAGVKNGEFDG